MKSTLREIIEWLVCIIVAVVLALVVRYYIGTPTIVQQRSMFPTLKENERLRKREELLNKALEELIEEEKKKKH